MPINLKPFALASAATGGAGRQDGSVPGNDMDGRKSEFPDDDDDGGIAFVVPPEPEAGEPPTRISGLPMALATRSRPPTGSTPATIVGCGCIGSGAIKLFSAV